MSVMHFSSNASFLIWGKQKNNATKDEVKLNAKKKTQNKQLN